MGKTVKKITGAIGKGIGAITGSNAARKAAEEQARMMDQQTKFEREQAAKAAEQAQLQARSQQSQIESGIERDKAISKAEDERKRAAEGSSDEVDVDMSTEGEVDADGRRINTREKFMSKRKGSSGIRL